MAKREITGKIQTWGRKEVISPLGPIAKYQIKHTFILSLVPIACGSILLMLLSMFAKLNLYYLEASGLMVDANVRDAYFRQVESEMFAVIGFLGLQFLFTFVISYVVVRWANSPFLSAQKMIETAMERPDDLRPQSRWLSESVSFDRFTWLFALRVRSGGKPQEIEKVPGIGVNLPFFIKFIIAFTFLSIGTGYSVGIIFNNVFRRIVDLGVTLIPVNRVQLAQQYFSAQEEVLRDTVTLVTCISWIVFFFLGLNLARYMSTMIFVFSRAMQEDRFPVTLRTGDIYHDLARTLNNARSKFLK